MDFGLNLILTFTDKATSGIRSAVGVLEAVRSQIDSNSSALANMRDTLSSLGTLGMGMTAAITAPISGFMTKILQYGVQRASFIEDSKVAFTSLMGDAKTASDELNRLLSFAKTTPFTYESIASSAQNMISAGVDNLAVLESKADGTFGGILQALGDLAGASGKGSEGFAGMANVVSQIAIEGKVGIMRLQQFSRAGIDAAKLVADAFGMTQDAATKMLKGMSSDEFIQTIVDIVEAEDSAYKGMMGEIKKTWTGAKDTFVSSLKTAGLELMGAFQDGEGTTRYQFLENMTNGLNLLSDSIKSVSPVLQPVMDFINSAMNKGAKVINKFANSLSTMEDGTRKLTPFGETVSNILKSLVLLGPGLIIFGKYGSVIASFFGSAKTTIDKFRDSIRYIQPETLRLAGLFAGVWVAWNTDLFGIQTMVFKFVSGVVDAWRVAREATQSSADDMMNAFNKLDSGTFLGNLTANIMKAIVFVQALSDAWSDGEMDAELYQKAVDVGVIDLISRILDFKYRVEEFIEGFKKGWNEANESIRIFIEDASKNLKGTIFEDIFEGAEKFFTLITEADLEDWRNFGKDVGELAPKTIALGLAFRGLAKAASGLSTIGTILGGLGKIKLPKLDLGKLDLGEGLSKAIAQSPTVGAFKNFGKVMVIEPLKASLSGIGNQILVAFSQTGIGSTIMNGLATAIEAVAGAGTATIGAILAGVLASVVAFAFKDPEGFTDKITQLKDGIIQSFSDLWDRLKTFFEPITDGFDHLKEAFGNLVDSVQNGPVFQKIVDIFSDIGRVVMDVVVPAFNGIVDVVTTVFGNVVNIVSEVFGGIIDIISGIINIISGIFSGDLSLIVEGVSQIFAAVVNVIGSILEGAINVVISIVNAILHTGLGLLEGGIDIVRGVFNVIVTFIGDRINGALTTIQNVVTTILNLLGFKGAAEKVGAVFDAIKNAISNAVNKAKDIVKNAIDAIKGAFNFSWKLPELKLPHISVKGGEAPFGIAGKGSLPQFSVDWYAQGGVFNKPSVIGVGEAGTEAVVPLENNTEWIGSIASKFLEALPSPVASGGIESIASQGNGNIESIPNLVSGDTISNNNTNKTNDNRRIDNSVSFNEGAVQISMSGSSDIDVANVADRIMKEIARRQQIANSMNYGLNYAYGG